MYLWFLGFLVLFVTAERCQTPGGQRGECVPLGLCRLLLWSFSNPKEGMLSYLQKFICSNTTEKGIFVCCRVATDILVFEDEDDDWDPYSIHSIKKLVNINTCGVQSGYVQGDGVIGLYDFPWLVKIMTVNNAVDEKEKVEKVGCTGVLINRRYVLYTAQCHHTMLAPEQSFYARIDSYTGYGSDCDTASTSYSNNCATFATYKVEEFVLHPFYDPVEKLNDIALLRLSRSVAFSEFMHPICLPLLADMSSTRLVHTSGWKKTANSNELSVKITYTSTLIPNCDCKEMYELDNVLTTYDMCTVNGVLTQDEVIGYPVTSLYKNQWYILGFTSRGTTPRINTRVQNYLQWIKDTIGGDRCLTPSSELGECIQITKCSKVMDAFANAAPKDQNYLVDFVCENPIDDEEDNSRMLKVCCGNSTDFTIFANRAEEQPQPYIISNASICGFYNNSQFSTDNTVLIDDYPWLAVIINATLETQRDGICGGTLINDRYVLTSVQCSQSFHIEDTLLVRLGDYNLRTSLDCLQTPKPEGSECTEIHEYGVEEKINHPFYNKYHLIHDISLLRLSKTVTFSEKIHPICLPTSEDDLPHLGDTLYSTGFGDNKKDLEGPRLKKSVPTTLISLDVCKEKSKRFSYLNPITDYQICTEDYKNLTEVTCVSEEGGPLMFLKETQWFIEGISSTFGCRDDEPQTHLNVFKYLKWIKLNIKE